MDNHRAPRLDVHRTCHGPETVPPIDQNFAFLNDKSHSFCRRTRNRCKASSRKQKSETFKFHGALSKNSWRYKFGCWWETDLGCPQPPDLKSE